MSRISTPLGIIIMILIAIILFGYLFFWPASEKESTDSGQGTNQEDEKGFSYLQNPVWPEFLGDSAKADNVYFSLAYNVKTNFFHYSANVCQWSEEGEGIVCLPNQVTTDKWGYQRYSYQVFDSGTSHTYGGTGLKVDPSDKNLSISHIGLNMNNPDLVKDLKAEVVLSMHDFYSPLPNSLGSKENSNFFSNLFKAEEAQACGPSNITQLIGDSELELDREENGIYWYKLKTPISLYDPPIGECYNKDGSIKADENGCRYCEENACDNYTIHEDEYYICRDMRGYFCYKWAESRDGDSLKRTRISISYQPVEKSGLFTAQVANIILKDDKTGEYLEPEFDFFHSEAGEYANSYNAFLLDQSCFQDVQEGNVHQHCIEEVSK